MNKEYPLEIRRLETSNLTRRRALGLYEIAGGVLGIGLVSLGTSTFFSLGLNVVMLFAVSLALYIFSILSGILLLRNKEAGFSCSLLLQALQAVGFYLNSFGLVFVSGVNISIGMDVTGALDFSIYANVSNFEVRFGGVGIISRLGAYEDFAQLYVNLIAIALIYYIFQLRKNIQKEILLKAAHDIAEKPSPGE